MQGKNTELITRVRTYMGGNRNFRFVNNHNNLVKRLPEST